MFLFLFLFLLTCSCSCADKFASSNFIASSGVGAVFKQTSLTVNVSVFVFKPQLFNGSLKMSQPRMGTSTSAMKNSPVSLVSPKSKVRMTLSLMCELVAPSKLLTKNSFFNLLTTPDLRIDNGQMDKSAPLSKRMAAFSFPILAETKKRPFASLFFIE